VISGITGSVVIVAYLIEAGTGDIRRPRPRATRPETMNTTPVRPKRSDVISVVQMAARYAAVARMRRAKPARRT
jgi:hypothetical protein